MEIEVRCSECSKEVFVELRMSRHGPYAECHHCQYCIAAAKKQGREEAEEEES